MIAIRRGKHGNDDNTTVPDMLVPAHARGIADGIRTSVLLDADLRSLYRPQSPSEGVHPLSALWRSYHTRGSIESAPGQETAGMESCGSERR